MEIITTKQKKKNEKKWGPCTRLQGQYQGHWCLHETGPRRRRKKEPKKIYEDIIAENFPNQGKERVTQAQEAQTIPYRMNILAPRMELGAWPVLLSIPPRDRPCHFMSQNCYRHNWLITKKLGYFYMMGAGNDVY